MARRFWSVVLVSSLSIAAWPARADGRDTPKTLRASVERVLAQAEVQRESAPLDEKETRDLGRRARALKTDPAAGQMAGGGGMGKMLILTLLTTAISVGTYMYVIKKTKEQTTTSTLR